MLKEKDWTNQFLTILCETLEQKSARRFQIGVYFRPGQSQLDTFIESFNAMQYPF